MAMGAGLEAEPAIDALFLIDDRQSETVLADRAHLVTRAFRGLRLVEQRQAGDWVSLVYAR